MSPGYLLLTLCLCFPMLKCFLDYDPNIFDAHPCSLQCNGRVHTRCVNKNHSHPKCILTENAISQSLKDNMQHILIMGHNGLRNRISRRMNVANMVEMIWHDGLATMAENYIAMCKPYETDECAMIIDDGKSFHRIGQNRYLQKNVHYPNLLIENAIRAWYLERDEMKGPSRTYDKKLQADVGLLKSENNFTHIASPLSGHFGCGFNKITEGFLLICNYHPYQHFESPILHFMSGDPGSLCPVERPMKNIREKLTNLCIGVERNSASVERKFLLTFYFLLYMLLFICY